MMEIIISLSLNRVHSSIQQKFRQVGLKWQKNIVFFSLFFRKLGYFSVAL